MTPAEAISAVKELVKNERVLARTGDASLAPAELDALGLLLKDASVVDRLNLLLSADEWPGASGMEDVCEIVRGVRLPVPDAPEWSRH